MAVEARSVDLFPTRIIPNRDPIVKSPTPFLPSQAEDFIPLSMTETSEPIVRPKRRRRQQLRIVPELSGVKPSGKADGGSSTAAFSVSRNHHKRSRDAIGDDHLTVNPSSRKMSKASPFQLPGRQSEIDRLVSRYTRRLRLELKDKVKQQSKALLSSIQDSVVIKLKEKDDEIQRMGKLNWMLQEKVKSLAKENQIWRGLAQTNEGVANTLRSNLEHALARGCGDDDAESCCGSNDPGRDGGDAAAESRRACGERESSVLLLLPRRHLRLCARRTDPATTTARRGVF